MQVKIAKPFLKPNSAYYNKTMQISRKEQQIQMQATTKYQKFKKSASLPTYYINKARLKKIAQIYRTLSSDKINVYNSKSRRNSPSVTPQKRSSHPAVFSPITNYLQYPAKPKAKLTLQRGNQNNKTVHQSGTSWAQIAIKLRSFTNRFEEIYNIKQQTSFTVQLNRFMESFREKGSDYSGKEQLIGFVKIFQTCMLRREAINIQSVKKTFASVSQEINTMQIQLKKKQIRSMLDQRQIQKYQTINKDLTQEITTLKANLLKQSKDVICGTQSNDDISEQIIQNSTQNIFTNTELNQGINEQDIPRKCCNCFGQLQRKTIKINESMNRIQALQKRQKQLLSVLVILRGQGVNVQKIYDDVINDELAVRESVQQLHKKQRKLYSKYRQIKQSPFDADHSILSSADGLSFNYQQKSLEEDVFTIRREYKCKKSMNEDLKGKLKLNFKVLYDQQVYQDDYQSEDASNPPTI